jgi:hypothetical protein
MLLMLVAGVGMSWLVAIKKRGDRQRAAVEAIVKGGGWVEYDYEISRGQRRFGDPNLSTPGAASPWPAWLRHLMGEDCFASVIAAQICSNTDLKVLADLGQLQDLKLTERAVVDDSSGRWPVARRSFSDTDDWAELGRLSQLRSLDLRDWCATDARLAQISGLTQLEYLNLWLNGITDKGLEKLKNMTQLRYLDLSHNYEITDAGLKYLEQMTRLEELNFDHNNITDAGLEHLKGLTKLKSLGIWTTGVSDEGIANLQAVLPNCKIDFGFE